jgi:competence protein ComEC
VFSCIGAILLCLKSPEYIPKHYVQIPSEKQGTLLFRIEKRLKPSAYQEKYYAQLLQSNNKALKGRILVNLDKDSSKTILAVDDLILTSANLVDIQKPLNPHQFDYGQYLKNHSVYRQVYLNGSNYLITSSAVHSIYGFADRLRSNILAHLKTSGFSEQSIQMVSALLLGQKQDIDEDLYNNYINAGTVHILAVSGLHVGIILLLLTRLFKPLLAFKHGRFLSALFTLIFLWSFALIAGLSPSVTRAVTMFSLVSVALHLKRETNIFNTLILSAFILLVINPNYLFEVGFQLSYTAVLSIVSFQPLICSLWNPNNIIIKQLWQIFGVTLAAQLGVAPLSLFYFHQFPGLFFISNLVIVPLLGLILGFGLLVIVLSLLDLMPAILVTSFDFTIQSLNDFIAWVAGFEHFLLRNISFDGLQVFLCYILIISGFWAIRSGKFKWVLTCLLSILCLEVYQAAGHLNTEKDRFLVFHKSRYSVIGIHKQKHLLIHHNLHDSLLDQQQFLSNYKVGEKLKAWQFDKLHKVFGTKTHEILCLDSTGVYQNLNFKPDILLLRQSPKVNFERVLATLKPKQVVADGSNYKSFVQRWKHSCEVHKTPFHYTREQGVFILED